MNEGVSIGKRKQVNADERVLGLVFKFNLFSLIKS
jgi:hypothetical protein